MTIDAMAPVGPDSGRFGPFADPSGTSGCFSDTSGTSGYFSDTSGADATPVGRDAPRLLSDGALSLPSVPPVPQ
ncbi:hypothetical protein [Streptomyces mirabilis]|uniref:hypothetical protein n=1 Tax=Streptomyces mirabilis TaxID=68239 RepID=UPI003CCF31F8